MIVTKLELLESDSLCAYHLALISFLMQHYFKIVFIMVSGLFVISHSKYSFYLLWVAPTVAFCSSVRALYASRVL